MSHTPQHTSQRDRRACIDECGRCHAVCLETLAYCLQQGGGHAAGDHVGLLLDCAAICQTSADYMLRGSRLHGEACAVCADVCDQCAASCASMSDDERMARCADACRRCAESCRRMAGGTKIAHAA